MCVAIDGSQENKPANPNSILLARKRSLVAVAIGQSYSGNRVREYGLEVVGQFRRASERVLAVSSASPGPTCADPSTCTMIWETLLLATDRFALDENASEILYVPVAALFQNAPKCSQIWVG
jgi:hypothetical protein